MDFSVEYSRANSQDDAFTKVQEKITPEYIAKFKVTAKIKCDRESGNIVANGKGFTLTMDFLEDMIVVKLKLSLLLKPFRKTILSSIEEKVRRTV